MSRIFDITRPLHAGAWTWPGDTAFSHGFAATIGKKSVVNVGHFTTSCHCGTHIDAPFHFEAGAPTTEEIPLDSCIGPCEVLPLAKLEEATAPRVLVKAGGKAPKAKQLEKLKPLLLLGTDFHSMDPLDSKTLEAHKYLWSKGTVILEELDLSKVPDGRYALIALPIKLVGMDAAPVRAVLVEP